MESRFQGITQFYSVEKIEDKESIIIDPILVVEFWESLGYRKYKLDNRYRIVKIQRGSIVTLAQDVELREELRDYVKFKNNKQVLRKIYSQDLVLKRLYDNLETIEINFRYGDSETAYFFYLNSIIKVTKTQIEPIDYEDYNGYVWFSQINQREIKPFNHQGAEFNTFLIKIADNNEDRFNSLISLLGYLLHSYKDPAISKAIILMDMEISHDDNTASGGTGKSLIGFALSKIISTVFFNGKNLRPADKFFLSGIKPENKLMFFDDVTKRFEFESFYSLITGDMPMEKKYKDSTVVDYKDSPKLLISSNYIIKGTGGNAEYRRKIEFEVSSYFKNVKTPLEEFGHRLFDDWDIFEWLRFDNLMIRYAQRYLTTGIIEPISVNAKMNRLISDTSFEFVEFMDDLIINPSNYNGEIRRRDVNFNKTILLTKFSQNNNSMPFKPTAKTFKKWIDIYCQFHSIRYLHHKSNGGIYVALYNIIKEENHDDISEIEIEE